MSCADPDSAKIIPQVSGMKSVPIIDLGGQNGLHDPDTLKRVATEIMDACSNWGFFQVINHGVRPDHLERVWNAVYEFFALPKHLKRSLERSKDNPWGYFDHELTKNQRDKKEIFDISPTDNSEFSLSNNPFSGATPWPEAQPKFKSVMREHFDACERLSIRILEAICLGLGHPKNHLIQCFQPNHTSFLRLNYYPVDDPLSDVKFPGKEEAGLGVHHHSDAGAITVLIQDHVGGLQVYKDGFWHPVHPVEGAFVINIGDMVQVWSNDVYRAALHRVIAMDRLDRYSIPFFFNPNYETVVEPLEPEPENKLYKGIHWGAFRRRRADGDYENLGKEVQITDYVLKVDK